MSIKSFADLNKLKIETKKPVTKPVPGSQPKIVKAVPKPQTQPQPKTVQAGLEVNVYDPKLPIGLRATQALLDIVVALHADRLIQDPKAKPRIEPWGTSGAGHAIHWLQMSHWFAAHKAEVAGQSTADLFGINLTRIEVGPEGYRQALINLLQTRLVAAGVQVKEVPAQDTYDALAEVIAQEQAEKAEREAIESYVPPHLRKVEGEENVD